MVAAMAATTLLVACGTTESVDPTGTNGGSETHDSTLSIITPWGEATSQHDALDEIVAKFEESHPNITVEVSASSEDQNQTIFTTRVLAGDAPDIVFTNPVRDSLTWVEQGATVPVDDYLAAWELTDTFFDDALSEESWLTLDGQLRGFPLTGFVWPTWYHSADLESTGGVPPATEDEVELYLAGLDRTAVVVGGNDWSGLNAFIMTLQAYIEIGELNDLLANGGWTESETARQGTEWFVELRELGYWSPESTGQTVDGANAAFQGGQASGFNVLSDFFPDVAEELVDEITLGGIPLPDDATVDNPVVMSSYNASGLMISSRGAEENLEAIEIFVRYFYEPENISIMVEHTGMNAAAEFDESAVTHPLAIQAGSTEFRDSVTFVEATVIPADVIENLTRALGIAWTPGATVDDILDAMDAIYG